MAHATDYPSRPKKHLDMKALAFKQTVRFILDNKGWPEVALRDHALQCYGKMGLDTDTFNSALKLTKEI